MKIKVWKRYAENRASEPIEEGVYEQSDPQLQGLARYLIDNGNARIYVEPVPVVEVAEEVEPDCPRIEDEARELTVENDKVRKENVKAKKPRKAKS